MEEDAPELLALYEPRILYEYQGFLKKQNHIYRSV